MPGRADRGARSRERILRVATELCADRGYAAVTMEAVAVAAKVGKPTLYRWWSSKAQLLLDALLENVSKSYFLIPDTGDIEADLKTWISHFVDLFADPPLRALCVGVIGAHTQDPDLKSQVISRIHRPAREHNQARIRAEQSAGRLAGIDPDLLEDLLIGPLWYRALISDMPVDIDLADQLAAAVLSIHLPAK